MVMRSEILANLMKKKGPTMYYVCGRADPDMDDYHMACRVMAYKKTCRPESVRIFLIGMGVYRDLGRLNSIKAIIERCISTPVMIAWDGDGKEDFDYDVPVEPKYGEYKCIKCEKILPEREVGKSLSVDKRTGYTKCVCKNCQFEEMTTWGPN